jgi:hypothetical protein
MSQPATAQLLLASQESLEQETVSKNGVQKNVHAVIKNQPFRITLKLVGANAQLNFHKYNIEATLVYDTDAAKAVDFVRKNPVEYETTVSDNFAGISDQVAVLMRLSVLSSQHEDMFFRVRFTLKCGKTALTVLSEPIKVVSKPAQLKKNKEPRKRKRSPNDKINEALARIEAQQREQQDIMASLIKTLNTTHSPTTSEDSNELELVEPSSKRRKIEYVDEKVAVDPQTQFEQHLMGLIQAYNTLPAEQRHEVVRNVMTKCAGESHEQLSEVIDCLWVEGLQKDIIPGTNIDTGSPFPDLALSTDNFGSDDLDSFIDLNVLQNFV